MKIVIQNLFRNAWKFTERKPVARIEFGVENKNRQRCFYVRDNGVGFDMAYVDKLFQPFHRLHSESEFRGSGIGLATVRRIVERHGGEVWAHGEVGRGAAFYFTLDM
jgi:light-regulated signal transduction histidine kinase (bacteriophytochrome)